MIFMDRIYRIIRIFFVHHFPEESDEAQSALAELVNGGCNYFPFCG